jgi:uncharacterized protein YbjT (DUF2867 family)
MGPLLVNRTASLCKRFLCICGPKPLQERGFDDPEKMAGTMTTRAGANRLVTVIGGSGFVGRQLVRSLARRGYRVRVACRRPDLAIAAITQGTPGQIALVQANVRFPDSLRAACEGAYAVVNLTGILFGSGCQSFSAVHAAGAEAAAVAARQAGAEVFVQMSALGVSPSSASEYAQTKSAGEMRTMKEFPGTQIVRPSVIFGPEDNFFNQFAAMARFAPALPLIGGGVTRFQPVFVGDVAEAMAVLVDRGPATTMAYDLGGPEVITFRNILEYILKTVQRKRLLLSVPFTLASGLGTIMGMLPKPPLTADQVELLKTDNIVGEAAEREGRTLAGLGVRPSSFRNIVPSYLYRYRAAGQFTEPSSQPE